MHTPILADLLASTTAPLALAGMVLIAGFLLTHLTFRKNPVARFVCQLGSFAGFTAMLAVARISPLKPTAVTDLSLTYLTVSVFKVVWWLAGSWLLAGLVRALLVSKRKPMETRFLQDLCAGAIHAGAILGIIAYVFDIPVTGLLAASGVIAIVLGLALQSTLGDVFSGIILNFAKPYRPGDWVILDGGFAGRVIQTDWRATQILTESNDLAIIPNSIIAKGRLINASLPTPAHGIVVSIRLDPGVAPSTAIPVLETALLGCNLILRIPVSTITVRSLDALALECDVQVFVAQIEQGPDARNEVFDLIFRHCISAGIRLAPPAGSAELLPARAPPPAPADIPRQLLEQLQIFKPMSDPERDALAPMMQRRSYKARDVVVEQGVVAPALVILTSGVLVALKAHEGGEVEIFRFAPGDCFCQASVLTGATTTFKVVSLTRATVYEIFKADLAPILKARPAIAADLAQLMARREAAGETLISELDDADNHTGHLETRLADRIKLLFGL